MRAITTYPVPPSSLSANSRKLTVTVPSEPNDAPIDVLEDARGPDKPVLVSTRVEETSVGKTVQGLSAQMGACVGSNPVGRSITKLGAGLGQLIDAVFPCTKRCIMKPVPERELSRLD